MTLLSSYSEELIEAGVDEVGRGCLAGPVVAAAVILPKGYTHPILNDSKQLSKNIREDLEKEIKKDALAWSVAEIDNEEIDKVNILNASFKAMINAVDGLETNPQLLLIDGNRFPGHPISHKCIIKGDSKYLSIAAASILAKTYRDNLMEDFSIIYEGYGWETNAGYATQKHRDGILRQGITPLHRKTFLGSFKQLNLFD